MSIYDAIDRNGLALHWEEAYVKTVTPPNNPTEGNLKMSMRELKSLIIGYEAAGGNMAKVVSLNLKGDK